MAALVAVVLGGSFDAPELARAVSADWLAVSDLAPVASRVASDVGITPPDDVHTSDALVELGLTGTADVTRIASAAGGARVAIVERHEQYRADDRGGDLRFVSFFTRRPGMTATEFWTHWTERHVPLVLRSRPGFHRYVTGRVVDANFTVDGVVEQWFASDDALAAHHGSVADKPEVAEDARRFVGAAESYVARRRAEGNR